MKRNFIFWAAFLIVCVAFANSANAQRRSAKIKFGKICGNPRVKCRTGDLTFQAHEIPFEMPSGGNAVISDSEPFYAVILKTIKLTPKINCENAISENERLKIQKLFPDHKVFASKCSYPDNLYYTNIAKDVNFIAVYAGKNLNEAKKFLMMIQATRKFKGAAVRRTHAGFNGT